MTSLHATPAPGFDDPLGLLAACHGRIRDRLRTLARLQRHLPEHGHDQDACAAARGLLKYFDEAAPNHHADEERSLFPRLAARSSDAAELLDQLALEHDALEAHWRRLRPLLAAIVAGQRANLSPRQVRELRSAYEAHIQREDDLLLPLAVDLLDPEDLEAIGREMAERRAPRP
jgi:hemerythrin-like domain-containing protein